MKRCVKWPVEYSATCLSHQHPCPWFAIATLCSRWVVKDQCLDIGVHPSASYLIFRMPVLSMGPNVKTLPGFNFRLCLRSQ
jgi:hypothetical protein